MVQTNGPDELGRDFDVTAVYVVFDVASATA